MLKRIVVTLVIGICLGLSFGGFHTHATNPEPLHYVAYLSQHGANAPTASVVYNTLGDVPLWSRVDAGYYKATLANTFPLGRTIVKVPTHQDSLDDYAGSVAQSDNSTVYVFSLIPTGQLSDDCWLDRWVEITVYPEP